MPAKTEPKSGLQWGWNLGEDGWNIGTDANWLKLGRFGFHLSVIDRNVTDPSTLTPANGDTYIVATSAVGAWAGWDGRVVVWDADAAVWVSAVPKTGWLAYIEDEQVLSAYKPAGWSVGVAI